MSVPTKNIEFEGHIDNLTKIILIPYMIVQAISQICSWRIYKKFERTDNGWNIILYLKKNPLLFPRMFCESNEKYFEVYKIILWKPIFSWALRIICPEHSRAFRYSDIINHKWVVKNHSASRNTTKWCFYNKSCDSKQQRYKIA